MRLALLTAVLLLAACATTTPSPQTPTDQAAAMPERPPPPDAMVREARLELVASSPRQWTGVAVSEEGRIFVNFPRWSENVPVSVAEVRDGTVVPWPDAQWNTWQQGAPVEGHFVAVQSVVIDAHNRLWVLDTGNPQMQGVITPPRLHHFDISTGKLVRTYTFGPDISSGSSYLNDVRVDTDRQVAYLTDSGAGGLVVLDLQSGQARKVLREHPSTHAEASGLTVMGHRFERQIHSDGIALTDDGQTLYWAVLTGHSLYRIPTEALRDASLSTEALAARIERVQEIVATDGILWGESDVVWLGGLEDSAIYRYTPGGAYTQVLQDDRLRWPDSLAQGPKGYVYVTTSQIHLPPAERGPYELYRFMPPAAP